MPLHEVGSSKSSWPGLFGPPVAARAGIGGPNKPGHDVNGDAIWFDHFWALPYRTLLASLIAHGTNLGLTAMGSSVERLTAADLQHASRWLVRDATLKAANAQIIEYQHRLTFAAIWGDGRLSSSDGQRFAAPPGTLIGAYHPRYFGYYDRAVSVYSHLSDRLGVYGTRVISCAPREAT